MWSGTVFPEFPLWGYVTLDYFEIFLSLDSLNRSARWDLLIGTIFSRFWNKRGKLFWKNHIFQTFCNLRFRASFDFGRAYCWFKIVRDMIWECFCWCYDPKSSKNMFLGETKTKLIFYSLKFEIYSFRFGILENQFSQNVSPHFCFCSLKIAPFDSSRKSDRFSLFKLQLISKGGKLHEFFWNP